MNPVQLRGTSPLKIPKIRQRQSAWPYLYYAPTVLFSPPNRFLPLASPTLLVAYFDSRYSLTFKIWIDPRWVGSKLNQDRNVKSLPHPFHYMLGSRWPGPQPWWKETALQLHRVSNLSTHLCLHNFSGCERVYRQWKERLVPGISDSQYFNSKFCWNNIKWYLQKWQMTTTAVKVCQYDLPDPISVTHTTCSMFSLLAKKTQLSHSHYFLGCT